MHSALVRLVADWTASDLQARVAETAHVDLDPAEVRGVYLVGLAGGSLGATALAERAHLTRPTTSKLVSRLAVHGLVERFRSGRSVEVRLTAAGVGAYQALVDAGHDMIARATAGWTPDEVETFHRQLSRFVQALPHGGPEPHTADPE